MSEDWDFTCLFGMSEMEKAAKKIVVGCLKVGSWDCSQVVDAFDPRNGERDGYLCLISGGFLQNRPGSGAHGEFVVTQEFARRVAARVPEVADLKDLWWW